jgi:hypothetical protein
MPGVSHTQYRGEAHWRRQSRKSFVALAKSPRAVCAWERRFQTSARFGRTLIAFVKSASALRTSEFFVRSETTLAHD